MGAMVLGTGLLHIASPTVLFLRPVRGLWMMLGLSVVNVVADGVLGAVSLSAEEGEVALLFGALVAVNAVVFGVLRRPEVSAWSKGG